MKKATSSLNTLKVEVSVSTNADRNIYKFAQGVKERINQGLINQLVDQGAIEPYTITTSDIPKGKSCVELIKVTATGFEELE